MSIFLNIVSSYFTFILHPVDVMSMSIKKSNKSKIITISIIFVLLLVITTIIWSIDLYIKQDSWLLNLFQEKKLITEIIPITFFSNLKFYTIYIFIFSWIIKLTSNLFIRKHKISELLFWAKWKYIDVVLANCFLTSVLIIESIISTLAISLKINYIVTLAMTVLVVIFFFWFIYLLWKSIQVATGLSTTKVTFNILISIVVMLLIMAGIQFYILSSHKSFNSIVQEENYDNTLDIEWLETHSEDRFIFSTRSHQN